MPILKKLKDALDQAKISYEVYDHPQAFTAQEIAATQHISGREMAKVVILKVNSSFVMVVLPSNRMVSFEKVKVGLRVREASLATEEQFALLFPECEIGAMPPFGNFFGPHVYVDPASEKIIHPVK